MITAYYASTLALIWILLTVNVIQHRWKEKVSFGGGNISVLQKAVRAHGNFSEVVPLALLLLFIAEYNNASHMWLHILGISLVLGRISHVVGLLSANAVNIWRMLGMILGSFVPVAGLAILNIALSLVG